MQNFIPIGNDNIFLDPNANNTQEDISLYKQRNAVQNSLKVGFINPRSRYEFIKLNFTLASEISRIQSVDKSLNEYLHTEISRATFIETSLQTRVSREESYTDAIRAATRNAFVDLESRLQNVKAYSTALSELLSIIATQFDDKIPIGSSGYYLDLEPFISDILPTEISSISNTPIFVAPSRTTSGGRGPLPGLIRKSNIPTSSSTVSSSTSGTS